MITVAKGAAPSSLCAVDSPQLDQAGSPIINRRVYASPEVKTALKFAQHNKCCFCESKITHICEGDVEHFRPKLAWRQAKGDALQYPGYYWLAYKWDNLFLSCDLCNRRFKENLFPLCNPRERAMSPQDSIASEQPLFICPTDADIEKHIAFKNESIVSVPGSLRGHATIQSLGLDRTDLEERRRDLLFKLKAIAEAYEAFRCIVSSGVQSLEVVTCMSQCLDVIHSAKKPSAEFSAMASQCLPDL